MWRTSLRSSTSRALLLVALLLAALSQTVAEDPRPSPHSTIEQAREILSHEGYQTRLPIRDDEAIEISRGLRSFVRVLIWIAIVVVAILMVYWVANEFFVGQRSSVDERRQASDEHHSSDPAVDPEAPARLARQGRFGEAIHAMLLVSIRRLTAQLPSPPSPASTSRELLRAFSLPPQGQRSFAALVHEVELSWFGGRTVSREDYGRCLAHFDVLVPEGRDGQA